MSGGDLLDAPGQALPEVKAVADLYGLGGAISDALPVSERAVAADNLNSGMLPEPMAQLLGVPSFPEREWEPGGGVDQEGPVPVFVEGEVVHAQGPRRLQRR